MKFKQLSIFVLILLSGCCKDEIVQSYRFNEFEKSLIPYTSSQELTFTDNNGNILIANIQKKERKIETKRPGPESCELTEYELEKGFLVFQNITFTVEFELTANFQTSFVLTTRSEDFGTNELFDLRCVALSIPEQLTDLSINQFDFQNVLIFQNCNDSIDVERIVYSPLKGVEYIEFTNGDYWKLN